MPNWTYGALVIKEGKEKTEEILKSVLSGIGTKEERVDFNILIPSPEDLNIISGSNGDLAAEFILLNRGSPEILFKDTRYMGYQWLVDILTKLNRDVQTLTWVEFYKIAKEDKDFIKERFIDWELGEKYISNLEKYGFKTWYEWSVQKWGTKWNGCEYSFQNGKDGETILKFQTAWCSPRGWLNALFTKFPNEDITYYGCYEDGDYIEKINDAVSQSEDLKGQEYLTGYNYIWGTETPEDFAKCYDYYFEDDIEEGKKYWEDTVKTHGLTEVMEGIKPVYLSEETKS